MRLVRRCNDTPPAQQEKGLYYSVPRCYAYLCSPTCLPLKYVYRQSTVPGYMYPNHHVLTYYA